VIRVRDFEPMSLGGVEQSPLIDLPPGKSAASRSNTVGASCCHS